MSENGSELMVTIHCLVYNHEKYLRQCLDGFVNQKTNFKYKAVVHDDASTDRSAEIIREYSMRYPTIIEPIIETENLYTKGFAKLAAVMDEACTKGRYIAFCEGDDYWSDPYKLQKQFDYMENHPECSLLHTAFKFYDEENRTFHDSLVDQEEYRKCKEENLNVACEVFDFNYRVVTASSFLRTSIYLHVISDPDYYKYSFFLGDIQLWTMMLQYGEIGYLPDYTTVYRVHADSACRQTNMERGARNSLDISEMQMHFLPKVKGGEYLRNKIAKNFRINLFKYRLFNPQYKSFVNDDDCKLNSFYEFVLSFSFLRYLIKGCWKCKRRMMGNSPTKIESMK